MALLVLLCAILRPAVALADAPDPPGQVGFQEESPPVPSPPVPSPTVAPIAIEAGFREIESPRPTGDRPPAAPASSATPALLQYKNVYERRRVPGFFGIGVPLLAVTFAQGAFFLNTRGFTPASVIPVIGPVLLKYYDASNETALVANTVGQTAGLVLILVGALWKPERLALVPVTLCPMVTPSGQGGGLQLSGTW